MLSSASSDLGKIKFGNTYYYVEHQILYGLSLGVLGFVLTGFIYYRFFQKYAFILLVIGLVFLVLVFTPLGFRHASSSRWLNLGPVSFQPSELLKFIFIIYLAAWLAPAKKEDNPYLVRQKSFWTGFVPFLIISGLVAGLILIQPSTSTLIIIMVSGLVIYFVSGAKIAYVLLAVVIGVLVLTMAIYFTSYRYARVASFLDQVFHMKQVDVQAGGYHLNEALIAIGSGGLWGVGFGNSTNKFMYLPEPIGDSIFAVIAEELGFVGALGLIAVFAAFLIRGLIIAKKSRDQFAKLVTLGFISEMAIQAFINIAAISGLIPLTGVPLPFVSYGGTSLAVLLTMSGVIVNISRYTT